MQRSGAWTFFGTGCSIPEVDLEGAIEGGIEGGIEVGVWVPRRASH